MKPGAAAVAGALGRNLVLALLTASAILVATDPQHGGVMAGFVALAALLVHATVFGVAGAVRVAPPALLRTLAALAVLSAAATGVFAASGDAFQFHPLRMFGASVNIGALLMQLAAFVLIVGAGGATFLIIAARAEALLEDDSTP